MHYFYIMINAAAVVVFCSRATVKIKIKLISPNPIDIVKHISLRLLFRGIHIVCFVRTRYYASQYYVYIIHTNGENIIWIGLGKNQRWQLQYCTSQYTEHNFFSTHSNMQRPQNKTYSLCIYYYYRQVPIMWYLQVFNRRRIINFTWFMTIYNNFRYAYSVKVLFFSNYITLTITLIS